MGEIPVKEAGDHQTARNRANLLLFAGAILPAVSGIHECKFRNNPLIGPLIHYCVLDADNGVKSKNANMLMRTHLALESVKARNKEISRFLLSGVEIRIIFNLKITSVFKSKVQSAIKFLDSIKQCIKPTNHQGDLQY